MVKMTVAKIQNEEIALVVFLILDQGSNIDIKLVSLCTIPTGHSTIPLLVPLTICWTHKDT